MLFLIGLHEDKFAGRQNSIPMNSQASPAHLSDTDWPLFLSTLVHDLRNQIMPMKAALKLLEPQNKTGQEQTAYEILQEQCDKMSLFLDDLGEIALMARHELQLNRERINPREVIEAALATSEEPTAPGRSTWEVQLPEESLYVHADRRLLIRVLRGASRYLGRLTDEEEGRITIKAFRAGEEVVIQVKDKALDLMRDQLSEISASFRPENRPAGGERLDITLYLINGLVELHGGRVDFKSGIGEVKIRLPLLE